MVSQLLLVNVAASLCLPLVCIWEEMCSNCLYQCQRMRQDLHSGWVRWVMAITSISRVDPADLEVPAPDPTQIQCAKSRVLSHREFDPQNLQNCDHIVFASVNFHFFRF